MALITDPLAALLRHADTVPLETWDDPTRGDATWQTLFSSGRTPTTGLSTGLCDLPPGTALIPPRPPTIESYYVITGTGVLTLGDAQHPVHAGPTVMILANTTNGLHNTGPTVPQFFYVFAPDSFTDVDYDFS